MQAHSTIKPQLLCLSLAYEQKNVKHFEFLVDPFVSYVLLSRSEIGPRNESDMYCFCPVENVSDSSGVEL